LNLPVPAGKWKQRFDSSDSRWDKDSELAKQAKTHTLTSQGEVELTVQPYQLILFERVGR
ncbi:MAG: hypothetical protein ABI835_21500, partial [Chloroflexota bacterium]